MALTRLLVANRGEIAIRIAQAATDAGLEAVLVAAADDLTSLHCQAASHCHHLPGTGAAAYLDGAALLAAASATGCDAVHPGYGFLSERADFARACTEAGLTFVGPTPDTLALFGDKASARALAQRLAVATLPGGPLPDAAAARALLASWPDGAGLMIKAVAGGGGRGMRPVAAGDDPEQAMARCASEAASAFGDAALYGEQLLPAARHVEIQVLGDGSGAVAHFGSRDCSLQRRQQKILECAPAPGLPEPLLAALVDAALTMARETRYLGLGTFEFLLDASETLTAGTSWWFIEANARLQVEHTISEAVSGMDLVQLQLAVAGGARLADLGLADGQCPPLRGVAIQARVNAERPQPDGSVLPASGTLTNCHWPAGPGIRVDSGASIGHQQAAGYDPLLAKVVVHSADLPTTLRRLQRALDSSHLTGLPTNLALLGQLARHPALTNWRVDTLFLDRHSKDLAPAEGQPGAAAGQPQPAADGQLAVTAPMQGTLLQVLVAVGETVAPGQLLAVLDAMKMEHEVLAPVGGTVVAINVVAGDAVPEQQLLLVLQADASASAVATSTEALDPEYIRPDLQEVLQRHANIQDEARPEAVARRRKTGQRTARENLDDLVDAGSFIEYAPLVVAAQKRRRSIDDLIARTPADGMLAGIGTVNAEHFGSGHDSRVAVATYDYTVLAGTQGSYNHLKKDRLFDLAERLRLPVVLFAEGGGGRPGDTDAMGVAGLDCLAFWLFGRLSGLVPLVGITSGRCFAGNAALLGTCDVIIATEGSNIGMGGPAMIEGGGLGVYRPEQVGPMADQVPNGVVDIAVADEAAAVAAAKQYLGYFQGPLAEWQCPDQRLLRHTIPENRLRAYQVRDVLHGLADTGSVQELRAGYGVGMVTALARIEGRAVGVLANNPHHLGGAIDGPAADKAVRFMQLCDAFDLPLLFLCDTPGFMVGPEVEKTGMVRQAGRLFTASASLSVPMVTVVLRKGYGLGAQAMAGGSFKAPLFTIAWPTGEFGGMGLEGAVKLGYRKELAAETDPVARDALYRKMVDRMYQRGKAVNMAMHFEIDAVVDPAETRQWLASAFASAPPPMPRATRKRPCIT